ncbi:MAG: DUF3857 domain-containing protein [Bacteroidetes bacterium]|nr:DUF3857 domain-containing protein [Bacteroidota bacterium]
MIKIIITLFYTLCALGLLAANPAAELQYYQNKYPNQKVVDISLKQSLHIAMVGGKPEIYQEEYLERIYLTDQTFDGKEQIRYSPIDTLLSIEAYTLVPEGNKYKKIPVKQFNYYSDIADFIFYDDSRACSFVFPALSKGSKTVYKTKKKINSLYFIHPFFFTNGPATEVSEARINYDNNVEMLFNQYGIVPETLETVIKKNAKNTVITYTMRNIPQMEHEKNVRARLAYIPHIVPRIGSYTTKTGTIEVLTSLDNLHNLYYGYIKAIDQTPEPAVKLLTDSITAGKTTEFDKVKAVYDWVQHNIRYVAIEDGDKGLVPEGAAQVFNKRYGDCKGMSNLMKTMLDGIGIQSHITWVGTSRLPYKYTELPSPVVDNHMILHYAGANGKDYILDATSEYQSIEYAPSAIQGKQCLISIDSSTYRVYEIPHSFNLVQQSMVINIDGTSLKITDTTCYNGNYKNAIAYALAHKSNSEKQRFYQNMLDGEGFPKSTVYNLQHTDIYAVDNPLCFYANFELRDYIIEIADELYMKPYFGKTVETSIDIAKRKYPFSLSNKGGWLCTQIINIPKEYSISHLPENIDFTHPLFALKVHYTHNKNQLLIDIDYHENFITLPTEDYEKWNEMNKLVRQVRGQSIVFRKN